MRKHILFIVAAMAGLAFSSCTEKETFTYHPSDLVAPVLSNLSQTDYVLTDGGTFDSFNFSSASVGFSASLQYELFAVLPLDGATPKSLGKVTNGTAIEVSASAMNNVLIGLDCPADEPVAVNFYVNASWMSNSNKAIGVGATSNIISANLTPYKAEKTYKSIYFRGGFNAWGASEQYKLYCYAEDDNTYMGTVDFDGDGKIADHVSQGFKFADSAWGDINLGSSDTEAEAGIITLVSGGDNIMSYTAHRYYSFEVDIAGLKAYKTYGFDNMGVIGLNGDWDNDHDMTWNPFYGRFYVDVEAPANTEFKFRLDRQWETDWGQGGARGGANIPLEAGNYRIYFYFNNFEAPTYEVNAAMYGQEEPKGEAPEPPVAEPVWALIGQIGDSNWDTDFALTDNLDGTWSTVATINGNFKIRYNGSWADEDVRGAKTAGFVAEDGVPFEVEGPGNDIAVAAPGLWKVLYDANNETVTLSNMANKWSLIGEINGTSWNTDFFLTEDNGVWTSEPVTFANADGAAGGFKIRYNASWDDANTRGAAGDGFIFEAGTEFDVVSPGANITAPSATDAYIVTFIPETNKVTINAALPQNCWSLIGGVEGSAWDKDFYMSQDNTGAWISDPITITGEFKLRYNNDWGVNRGGTLTEDGIGHAFAVTHDGPNIALPAYDVKYQIVYYADLEQVVVVPCSEAWSLIGEFNGKAWDYDLYLVYNENSKVWTSDIFYVEAEKGFKLRFNADWGVNRGGKFAAIGEPYAVAQDGDNFSVTTTGYYILVYNPADETVTIDYAWGVVGQVNGSSWDKDFWLRSSGQGVQTSAPFTAEGGFKIRAAGDWGANRGGTFVALGEPFAVVHDGANIEPPFGVKYTLTYDKTAETITVNAAE